MDGKDALQRQLSAAKVGSSSGAGKEQSVLSLMMEVEDLKTKVRREAVLCGATAMKVTRFGFAAVQGRGGASSRRWKLKEGGGVRGVDEEVSATAYFTCQWSRAHTLGRYEHLKATQKTREAAALDIAEKQKVQIKRRGLALGACAAAAHAHAVSDARAGTAKRLRGLKRSLAAAA
jgi:hypothetical protein